ncbi:hypothetical protein PMAYCL1PPCAC_20407, partial [Pristionchus mayeri]
LFLARRKNVIKYVRVRLRGLKKYRRVATNSVIRDKMRKIRERKQINPIETRKRKNKELLEFLQKQGPYPFSILPNELISYTISFLPMKDRLRARVDRRLNKIEAESKFHVNKLQITEHSIFSFYEPLYGEENFINFFEERSYSSDCIRTIARNTSIGELRIQLSGSTDFHREVYNLLKEFDVGGLYLRFENEEMENEIMVDSFFVDLARTCVKLDLVKMENITAEALYQVYKKMIVGESKLGTLHCSAVKEETCISFHRLIGITISNGSFFSNRGDIEAYGRWYSDTKTSITFFDGFLEMELILYRNGHNPFSNEYRGGMLWIKHANRVSLKKKKDGLRKIEFDIE